MPNQSISISGLYQKIKTDAGLQQLTARYRAQPSKEAQSNFKRLDLPYVTISGVFSKRSDKELLSYSGFIGIDCDGLLEDELNSVKEFARKDVHTVLGFTSPSLGYKLVIRSQSAEQHTATFNSYRAYISNITAIDIKKFDSSCGNLSRACFLCHDNEVYLNPLVIRDRLYEIPVLPINECSSNILLEKSEDATICEKTHGDYSLDYGNKNEEKNFKVLIELKEAKDGAYTSPREPWIHSLACYCNQFGMSQEFTLEMMLKYFANHPESLNPEKPINTERYIVLPVKDAYNRYVEQHGSWSETNEVVHVETPTLPDEIFPILPPFLQKLSEQYQDKRERDIVFLTALTVLSSLFPNYSGIYDQKRVWANLFLFIVAPPASGKGKIAAVRNLGNALQKQFDDNYKHALHQYSQDLKAYNQAKKDGSDAVAPIEPHTQKVFIPCNNTTSKIIETISHNKNFGSIMDTEADTLTQSLKSEFGNFSDVLRKTFHHEAVELERKLNNEYISLNKTHLSVLLAGTPNQVGRLISNVENGLLSRFLFYSYRNKQGFSQSIFQSPHTLPQDYFSSMSVDVEHFLNELNVFDDAESNNIEFSMEKEQEDYFVEWFTWKEKQLSELYGDEIAPSVYRLGLIAFRIAMILSIMRQIGQVHSKSIKCHADDFYIAILMVDTLLNHTITIFEQLAVVKKSAKKTKRDAIYFEKLPKNFTTADANKLASSLGINEKTAGYYLTKHINSGQLERLGQGKYQKIEN